MNKLFTIQLIFLSLSCSASASDESSLPQTGFFLQPDAVIKKLGNHKTEYKENFLLGVSHKKSGNKKKAIYHFANACFKYSDNTNLKLYPSPVYNYINGFHIKSEFYDDCAYEIASLFFDYREFEYVIKFIDLIDKSDTTLFRNAAVLKANSLMETGKYDEAISFLKVISERYKDINSKSLILIRIASAFEKKNRYGQAINEYLKILKLDNKSWQSGTACKRIIDILSKQNLNISINDKLLLGISIYYNSKNESLNFLEEVFNDGNYELKDKVLYYLVDAYINSKQFTNADSLISKYKNTTTVYFKLLKTKADSLWSINKKDSAINVYKNIFKEGDGILQRESHKKIAGYYVESPDKNKNYRDILIKYTDKYPEDNASNIFLWALAKDSLKNKDYNSAILFLEKSLMTSPVNPYSGKHRYWLAKLYSELKKNDDAERIIKEMIQFNPDSSYTWKVLEKIQDKYGKEDLITRFKAAAESGNKENSLFYHALLFIKEKDISKRNERIKLLNFLNSSAENIAIKNLLSKPEFSSQDEHLLNSIEKYFSIGYMDGIIRELELLPDKKEFRTDKFKALAYFGAKYNNYYLASVSILNFLKQKKIKENIAFLPEIVIKKLYPEAFNDFVEKVCAKYEIKKNLVYAFMKAESSFNPSAVSPSGATGLMQMMPATAAEIARGMNLSAYNPKDPETSLLFGIKYFSWLRKYFNGDLIRIIAGYNAGPGNVRKWTTEYDDQYDEDLFIEFIPFQETLHYVLRIQKYFILYNLIYGENNNE